MGMFDTAINGVRDFLNGPPDQDPREGPTLTPNMRNVMVGTGEDVSKDVDEGNFGAAAGHALRGTAAMFPAAAHDVLDGPAKLLAGAVGGNPNTSVGDAATATNTQLANGARAFVGLPPAVPTAGSVPPMAAPAGPPAMPGDGSNPTDARLAAGMQVPGGQTASNVMFGNQQGAAVAGADGVRKFIDGSGRTMYSNVPGSNGEIAAGSHALNVVPGMSKEAIQAANATSSAPSDTGGTPGLGIIGGTNYVSPEKEMADKFYAQVAQGNATRGMSARQAGAYLNEQRGQDKQEAIATMNNATQRDATARTVGATLRGQDLTHESSMYGHTITGANARARLQYDVRKDNRDYGLNERKFGEEQDQHSFERNEKATKDLHEEVSNMIPPGPDGKPDTATAARYAQGINAHVAAQQSVLRQRAAQGDPGASAALADLQKNGPAALDPTWKRNFVLGQVANDLSKQYGSGKLNPVGGTAVMNDVNVSGLRLKHNMILPNEYELLDEHGRPSGATIPERAVTGDGSFTPLGRARTDLRTLIRN